MSDHADEITRLQIKAEWELRKAKQDADDAADEAAKGGEGGAARLSARARRDACGRLPGDDGSGFRAVRLA